YLTPLKRVRYSGAKPTRSPSVLNTSGWAVVQLIAEAGPVAKGVLVVLGVFSVLCWALIIEKWWQFRQVRQQTAAFQRAAREGRRAALAAKKFRESPLAQLYVAGHQELGGFAEVPGPLGEEGEEEGLPRERLEAGERGGDPGGHGLQLLRQPGQALGDGDGGVRARAAQRARAAGGPGHAGGQRWRLASGRGRAGGGRSGRRWRRSTSFRWWTWCWCCC